MSTGNKGGKGQGPNQGQGQGQHNGGVSPQPMQQAKEGAEQVANRVRQGFESARDGLGQGYRQAEGTIARNPGSSVLVGFGVGFGLGVILVQLFAQQEKETWADRNLPKSLAKLPDQVKSRVQSAAKEAPDHVHHLAEAIMSRLPESLKRHLV